MPVHTRRYYFISCLPARNQTKNQTLEHQIQQAAEKLNTMLLATPKSSLPQGEAGMTMPYQLCVRLP
jgi:hypothetical protein